MADELEANVDITFELIHDNGLRFTRKSWRMYQHIFNRTIRTYLSVHDSDRPWQDADFREYMLAATRRIRSCVLSEVSGGLVDKKVFKQCAIAVMTEMNAGFMSMHADATGALAMLGPVCSDYLANPDDPPDE